MTGHCKDCKWWDERESGQHAHPDVPDAWCKGNCRRYAPREPSSSREGEPRWWPITTRGDWCGEYQPREAAPTPPAQFGYDHPIPGDKVSEK